jgi:hypothetical protein
MGGAVKPESRTPAENTVLLLQQAAQGGSPVLIPGAWDTRAVAPAVHVTEDSDPHSTSDAQASVVSDRERLERELEGGGAPSQRPRGHRASFLTKLWRTAVRPIEIAVIWSRVLPQPR